MKRKYATGEKSARSKKKGRSSWSTYGIKTRKARSRVIVSVKNAQRKDVFVLTVNKAEEIITGGMSRRRFLTTASVVADLVELEV